MNEYFLIHIIIPKDSVFIHHGKIFPNYVIKENSTLMLFICYQYNIDLLFPAFLYLSKFLINNVILYTQIDLCISKKCDID